MNANFLIDRYENKFWNMVDHNVSPDACWSWHGVISSSGSPQFSIRTDKTTSISAKKMSWIMDRGRIPEEKVFSVCENQNCVNPEHIFTMSEIRERLDL